MNDDARKSLRTLQIIITALAAGLTAFSMVALRFGGMASGPRDTQVDVNVMYMVLGGLAVSEFAAWLVLNQVFMRSLRQRWADQASDTDPTADLARRYLVVKLIPAALCESVALFAIVTYFLVQNPILLGVGAIGTVLILLQFPTEARLRGFVYAVTGREW